MAYRATHDPLTGLVNRTELEQRLRRVLSTAQAGRSEHALCYLDLDQFKVINETCGHTAEDSIDLARVRSINEIGHVMGKKTVAECVENKTVADMLRGIGVDCAQGYYIGRPRLITETA